MYKSIRVIEEKKFMKVACQETLILTVYLVADVLVTVPPVAVIFKATPNGVHFETVAIKHHHQLSSIISSSISVSSVTSPSEEDSSSLEISSSVVS